jgi:hypothetical protein
LKYTIHFKHEILQDDAKKSRVEKELEHGKKCDKISTTTKLSFIIQQEGHLENRNNQHQQA